MRLFKIIDTSFNNFDDTVQSFLSKALNGIGIQYTNTQIFGVIFNGIKNIMQNVMFYIEDALTEQNIYTATRKSSIYSLAKISGFEPSYGTSAGGILIAKLHINNGLNKTKNNLFIKNHSLVTNKNTGITYSIILPVDNLVINISNPLLEYQLKIQQGTFNNASYVASGLDFETVHIYSSNFDKEYIKVTVNGIEYSQTSCLYDMTKESEEYIINVGFDNSFDVIFGNDIYGKKLKDGDVVNIEYLTHIGTSGNIKIDEEYDFNFVSSGKDSLGNEVNINDYIDLTVHNYISGGNNADSIEFVRNMIGTNSRSTIYATADNIKLFLKRFSFIGYNNCYASLKENKVYIIALQNIENKYQDPYKEYQNINFEKDLVLTDDQKNMITSTLVNSNKTIAGFSVDFINPIFRKYGLICYIKLKSNYNKDIVKDQVTNVLFDYFINLSYDVKFISKSQLVKLILNNDTDKLISSIELSFISEYNETAYINGKYDEYANDIDYYEGKKTIQKYNESINVGLDIFGNISLNTIAEIPLLCGGFKYYPNKSNNTDKSSSIIVKPIEIFYI